MRIILIAGKARAGKDSVAKFLEQRLRVDGKTVLVTHYADLLKFICRRYCGWNGQKDRQGRSILQHIGTDVIRKREPDFWVDFVVKMLRLFDGRWEYVIIPDCRFPNELEVMRRNFPTIFLKVRRNNARDDMTGRQRSHASETALDDIKPDFYIENNGTLIELNNRVNEWIDRIL